MKKVFLILLLLSFLGNQSSLVQPPTPQIRSKEALIQSRSPRTLKEDSLEGTEVGDN